MALLILVGMLSFVLHAVVRIPFGRQCVTEAEVETGGRMEGFLGDERRLRDALCERWRTGNLWRQEGRGLRRRESFRFRRHPLSEKPEKAFKKEGLPFVTRFWDGLCEMGPKSFGSSKF